MRTLSRRLAASAGGLGLVAAGAAGLLWLFLETTPPRLGFDDTDNPAVGLAFLRGHAEVYAQAGAALLVLAIGLTVAAIAMADLLAERADHVALRATTTFGLFGAAFFMAHGIGRLSVHPLLYIDSLNHGWGEAAYVALQMVGVQMLVQGGLLMLSVWSAGVALIGARTRALPRWLCALAVIPAFHILSVLGPLGVLPDLSALWILFLISIIGTMLWLLGFGATLLWRHDGSVRAET